MDDREHYSRAELCTMLDAPAVETDFPGGGVRVVKSGIVGIGGSRAEAASDWRRKFFEMAGGPKPRQDAPGVGAIPPTQLHAPVDTMTEEAPPA
jgi:hypothetical protein